MVIYKEILNTPSPSWYYSAVTAFFFLSLAVNALVTALIVYRIISVYNDIRVFNMNGSQGSVLGHRDLSPLISILIESGLMTFVAQLIQTVMYKTNREFFLFRYHHQSNFPTLSSSQGEGRSQPRQRH